MMCAFLIRSVILKLPGDRREYKGSELPKAIKHYRKALANFRPCAGSVVLTISEMTSGRDPQPKNATTFAVISDTDGELYLTIPRYP